jgi:hypothetical protein
MTWVYTMDVCMVNTTSIITPISFEWGFLSKEIFGFVHTNLCGSMATTSHWRAKYFLTFIDNLSKKTFFYTMKTKFGVFNKLKVFIFLVKNWIGKKISWSYVMEVGSITIRILMHYMRTMALWSKQNSYTPKRNIGVVKRNNQIFVENVQCML